MRKAVYAAIFLFTAASLFAATPTCNQPNLLISGIQGDMKAPCAGAINFTEALFSVVHTSSSATGSGAGAGRTSPGTFRVTKYLDQSSAKLMLDCANGTPIQKVTLSYPQETLTINFEGVIIDSVSENTSNLTESVEFRYANEKIESGGNTKGTGHVLGSARPSSMSVVLVGSDGKSQPITHAALTVRRGGTTFDSVQLAAPPPATVAPRAGVMKQAGPTESISFNFGKIEFRSSNGSSASFQFNGGTLVNGNLRASKVSYTGPTTVAVHP